MSGAPILAGALLLTTAWTVAQPSAPVQPAAVQPTVAAPRTVPPAVLPPAPQPFHDSAPQPDATSAATVVAADGPAQVASTSPPNTPPTPPADYGYASAGRRDPFVRAIGRTLRVAVVQPTSRPPGVPGLMTAEVVVRGILESEGVWIAMVRASDGRTYSVRVGDRLMDGVVRAITADSMVILRDGPAIGVDQREVRKLLRGGEGPQ